MRPLRTEPPHIPDNDTRHILPQETDTMTASQTTSPAAAGNPQRRKALTALAAVVVLAGGAWGVYE